MHWGNLTYALVGALAIALLFAAYTDYRWRRIDNWLVAGIALAAPLFWFTAGLGLADIGWQLLVAVATFAVCAGLFAIRQMGGGDVKLLTALALWIAPLWFLRLLIVMALLGAVLTVLFGAWHVMRRQKGRIAIPYGISIASAGLWALASQYLLI